MLPSVVEKAGFPTRVALTGPVDAVQVEPEPECAQASSFSSTAACATGADAGIRNDVKAARGPRSSPPQNKAAMRTTAE